MRARGEQPSRSSRILHLRHVTLGLRTAARVASHYTAFRPNMGRVQHSCWCRHGTLGAGCSGCIAPRPHACEPRWTMMSEYSTVREERTGRGILQDLSHGGSDARLQRRVQQHQRLVRQAIACEATSTCQCVCLRTGPPNTDAGVAGYEISNEVLL